MFQEIHLHLPMGARESSTARPRHFLDGSGIGACLSNVYEGCLQLAGGCLRREWLLTDDCLRRLGQRSERTAERRKDKRRREERTNSGEGKDKRRREKRTSIGLRIWDLI